MNEVTTLVDDDATHGDDAEGPRRIGRHVVIGRIGEGAMGVVYAAFDPELSRKLAIKVLRGADRTAQAQRRLVREAQALARLSHPNVVQIYDVGTHDRQVYVAMEFVEGPTLRRWLQAGPAPAWPDILAILVAAGRGLAAAHRADLVHRDIKPDNVLITSEGVARVVDFGLARAASREPSLDSASISALDPSEELSVGDEQDSVDSLQAQMTRTGAVLGTPAYMAPEQWTGGAVDARSDQFSFCVTAWEALYGQRPFSATSIPLLGVKVTKGDIDPPPAGSRVPPRLRRALERGLAPDPDARHPDMDALLDALTLDPTQGRRRLVFGLAGVGLLAGGLWLGTRVGASTSDPCAAADDALVDVWDDARRDAVTTAMAATERPWAADATAQVTARLGAWTDGWLTQRKDACTATLVRGEQSSELMDLRIACLDLARVELGAVVDVLADADDEVVTRASQIVDGLPEVDACGDASRLRRDLLEPADPAQQEAVDDARAQLARVQARYAAGRYDAAEAELAPLMENATAIAWDPLLAEVLHTAGNLAERRGDLPTAEAHMRRAYLTAVGARHDRAAFDAAVGIVTAVTDAGGRTEEARRQWEVAQAELRRAQLGPSSEATLENARFRLEAAVGEMAAAREHIERSIALREEVGDDDAVDTAAAIANLATVQGIDGEVDAAVANLERALRIRARVQGEHHPDYARDLHNLGTMYARDGQHAKAKPLLEQALAIKLAADGPDHPDVAYSHSSLGSLAADTGDWDEAEVHHREALRIFEAAYGPTHRELYYPLGGLAEVHVARDQPERALPHLRRALDITTAHFGPDHPETTRIRELLDAAAGAMHGS